MPAGVPGAVSRPRLLVLITGTGTEVGKTWVGCTLLQVARSRGLEVAASKPLQSFSASDPPGGTDAALLAGACGWSASGPEAVCPAERSFPVPMAPPMAAAVLGRTVPTTEELATAIAAGWPAGVDLAVVEGAGGVASPLSGDGDSADLGRALGVDAAVVVADAELGVIHAARLAVAALSPVPGIVHLNRFDPGSELHRLNAAWLREREAMVVTTDVADLLDVVTSTGVHMKDSRR